jgi:carboxymethylenebutenolidase
MKKLFIALLSAVLFFGVNTTNAQSTVSGSMVQFHVDNGPDASAYYIAASHASNKVLIIFHEWFGLNETVETAAKKWQTLLGGNVAVYAVDLLDGKTATDDYSGGKLMSNLDAIRGENIVKGLIQKIGTGAQIATLGWGMGGTWAYNASALAGAQSVGCIMYYGYPVTDQNRIKAQSSDVLYLYGNYDQYITKSDMEAFGKTITASGHGFSYQTFNAPHDFASGNGVTPVVVRPYIMETEHMALDFLNHKLSL